MNSKFDPLEIEYNIIGAICLDSKLIRALSAVLRPEDFSIAACGYVYEAAQDADSCGKLFDGVIAADQLRGKLDNPRQFIADCINSSPTTAYAETYAKLLRKHADNRRVISAIQQALMEGGDDIAAKVESICSEAIRGRPGGNLHTMDELLVRVLEAETSTPKGRCESGYGRLDELLQGMWGGELIVLAARPAVGKSAFAMSIAENAARNGKTVFVCSLEMDGEQLAERMIARHTNQVDMSDLIERGLREEEWEEVAKATGNLSGLPILVSDSPGVTPQSLRAQALTVKGLGMVIVDYGGLMTPDRKYDSRNLELGAISRSLKLLAMELNVPVLMLAQLNRAKDEDEEPGLRELRDSGELEQNANKAIFLWNIDKETHRVGVKVAKNRRGKNGIVTMLFESNHMRFIETDEIYEKPKKSRKSEKDGKATFLH